MRIFLWPAASLATVWCFVYGELSLYQFAVGYLISALLLLTLKNYYSLDRKLPVAWVAKRAWYALFYLAIFCKDVLLANIDVARRILHPGLDIHPGIVAVHLPTESEMETAFVGSSITLTPGELVVAIDPEKRIFYIHCVDARRPDSVRAERRRYLDKYQGRIFR